MREIDKLAMAVRLSVPEKSGAFLVGALRIWKAMIDKYFTEGYTSS